MFTRDYLLGSLLAASATAWKTDVHNQIGFMAETFLDPYTRIIIGEILEPQYNGSIGRAAAWADSFAHTAEGRYSYQWHWIDSEDSPPENCALNYTQDCSIGGCVVSAIANQTSILRECISDVKSGLLGGGRNLTCSYALKWVTHYIGDIAQPLHASGLGSGGNRYNVTFGPLKTNLHSVWDGLIIYEDARVLERFSNTSLDPFFGSLVSRIHTDDFFQPTYEWLSCMNTVDPLPCALHWAEESNAWTCSYVYKGLDHTTDLATSGYAEMAFPIVELQVSKAALRLATWLNSLALTVKPRTKANKQDVLEL
ncbi:nuclease PA3 [Amniculicola lignicola CBS 123094]|uniref:Nuclease PA3 n=1 Tax=Amniculicola lignicola CBS 123094 TaxID=1392246 RepID=A0A6A5WYY1_9PLEO|nr:nuclease PA3 [Amniculicola lignicola CBS 123094]